MDARPDHQEHDPDRLDRLGVRLLGIEQKLRWITWWIVVNSIATAANLYYVFGPVG